MWKLRKSKDYKRNDPDLIKITSTLYLFKPLWLHSNCFDIIVGSKVKDIANSPRPCENASTSPVQNSRLFETSTDDVTPTSESSTEIVNISDNSNEAPNVSDRTDEHTEAESDSKEEFDASKECVDGQNDTRLHVANAEFDQGNSADESVESSVTQEKVSSYCLLIFMARLNSSL